MNRGLWIESSYSKNSWPNWPCSECRRGTLRVEKLELSETAESRAHPDPAPWDLEGRFHGVLKCDRCNDPAVVFGTTSEFEEDDGQGSVLYETGYLCRAMFPPPLLFAPPKRCPRAVTEELFRAFGLLLSDAVASGNAVRSCVEAILDHHRVASTTVAKGRRQRLSLHARIDRFSKTNAEVAAPLMAVKWIGNEGSHGGSLARNDVFDAFDVVEDVLERLWGDRVKELKRLVADINRRRRPRSLKRRRKKK